MDQASMVQILRSVRTVALVGASARPERPSYQVLRWMIDQGYQMIPVNPGLAGTNLFGVPVVSSLEQIQKPVDMVQVFRQSSALPEIAQAAIDMGARVLWAQLGVWDAGAADVARAAGLQVVMDQCPKIVMQREGSNDAS